MDMPSEILSKTVMHIFLWIVPTVMCQALDIFGIGTNIINMICFVKQGFKDPVNVSLLGLAVSDMGCLVTLIWTNISVNPAFSESDLPFDSVELQFLVSAIPHTTFTRISGWITAFVVLERCLCITAPLKVRSIVTSRRVSVIIICVVFIFIISVAPVYFVNKLGQKFYPARNKTLFGIIYSEDRVRVEKVTFAINNVLIPSSSFVVIIICTTILVVKLHTQTKWRNKSSNTTQTDNVSSRNQKVAKMVVMISILFIVCFFPLIIMFLAMSTDPRFSIDGEYKNTVTVLGGVGIVLESINSSSNIFFYYNMSSNYRIAFLQIFRIRRTVSMQQKY